MSLPKLRGGKHFFNKKSKMTKLIQARKKSVVFFECTRVPAHSPCTILWETQGTLNIAKGAGQSHESVMIVRDVAGSNFNQRPRELIT